MKYDSGESMFELLLAIGIVALILFALVSLATLSIRNASFARNQSEAARLGQETSEWLRSERDKGWDDFISTATSGVPGTVVQQAKRCLKGLSWSDSHLIPSNGDCFPSDVISNVFTRTVDFSLRDTNGDGSYDVLDAVVGVTWSDAQGSHVIKNSTYFTDWRQ